MTKTLKTGAINVTVDGTNWTLLCDFNAMIDFQEETGQDATEFLEKLEQRGAKDAPSMATLMPLMRKFIWACLVQSHPDATLRDAGRIISVAPNALMNAVGAAFPDSEDTSKSEGADQDGSTGDALGEGEAAQE
ncbi:MULTISPECIES: hypothetical protein [Pacificibacter]|uniref:hypothetical protein n=1 Tax=Pacificibacter TaxID=1042323 RepID=UPI001C0A0FF2|nr:MULTISPECIES: hypothetical protein [Pacificibacter]MBU2936982.1 hypothetical protein [Pacificibacter marinus]MDO6617158.1 hypothetical protein [Pacificibacter sp. 1_MG-2023]